MTSLVKTLYKSRRRLGQYVEYVSPVADLVRSLEALCVERGWTLSRWQTNSRFDGRVKRIVWAVHVGPRPSRSDRLGGSEIDRVYLANAEGTTERCEAYRKLSALLDRLQTL